MLKNEKHAQAQKRHAEKKQKSASRKCIWVPKDKTDEWDAAVAELKKKWNRDALMGK